MADGIANSGQMLQPLHAIIDVRQMLLPIFWLMLLPIDRCYCQNTGWCYCLLIDMADVIAIVGRC